MFKRVFFIGMAFAIALLLIAPAFAAYEFYVLHLTTNAKVMDWRSVEKSVRSVPGVEKVEVDKNKSTVSIFCKEKCTDRIREAIQGKLKAKGVQAQKMGGVRRVLGGTYPTPGKVE